MLTRIGIAIMWLLHLIPQSLLARSGQVLGMVFMVLARERRAVVGINLSLCFPDMTRREQRQLRSAHFRAFGRGIAETTVAWWSSAERVRELAEIEGKEHLDRAMRKGPTILLAPHFVGVEILAIRMSLEGEAQSMYSHQKDKVFDRFLMSRRRRFRPIKLISRQDGIKPVIRGLKARLPLFFLPDMDFGPRDTMFVPFFGVSAATVDAVPRLASLTGARIVPIIIRQRPIGKGYQIRISQAWENYPTHDVQADTRHMNQFIEECVMEAPEQYYWVHKRFKTRPSGEKRFY